MHTDPHAADIELFSDALTCEERMPAQFLPASPDDATPDELADAAEHLLRTLGHIDESHADGDDDRLANEPALLRLEAKLNLVLRLVADMARHERLPHADVRWSRRGIALTQPEGARLGSTGRVRLSLGPQYPLPLEMPVRVIASDTVNGSARLRLRFEPHRPALEAAMERYLFRLHRRALARRGR